MDEEKVFQISNYKRGVKVKVRKDDGKFDILICGFPGGVRFVVNEDELKHIIKSFNLALGVL